MHTEPSPTAEATRLTLFARAYRSGMIQQVKAPFRYGTIECRAKAPGGTGLWPLIFWLLGHKYQPSQTAQGAYSPYGTFNVTGADWPNDGWCEIDGFEFLLNDRNDVNCQIHADGFNDGGQVSLGFDADTQFAKYKMVWTATTLTWYVDKEDGGGYTQIQSVTSHVPTVPMYLIIGTAVGGTGGGSVTDGTLPQTMEVDWIRVLSDSMVAESAPTLSAGATGASLAAAASSSAPALSAGATGASLYAGDASSAPTLSGAATSSTGSDAVAGPTLSADATGASLAASATSAAPTLAADATTLNLGVGVPSSAPTLAAGATGASLAATAAASAPTFLADATGAIGPVAFSEPTLSAGATGASLWAAAASSAPSFVGSAASGSGSGSEDEWHPDFYHQGWLPLYYPEQ